MGSGRRDGWRPHKEAIRFGSVSLAQRRRKGKRAEPSGAGVDLLVICLPLQFAGCGFRFVRRAPLHFASTRADGLGGRWPVATRPLDPRPHATVRSGPPLGSHLSALHKMFSDIYGARPVAHDLFLVFKVDASQASPHLTTNGGYLMNLCVGRFIVHVRLG